MRVVFMGTPHFATHPLRTLATSKHEIVAVFAQPDRQQGRRKEVLPTPVHQLCIDLKLPYYAPTKLRDGQVAAQLKELDCDILVTAAYGRILPKEILEIPRLGCINIHGSLLPAYRGASPIQTALIDGCQQTGVTILRMVEEMDAGNILATASYDIVEEDDINTLMDKLSRLGANLLLPLLDKLEENTQEEIVQDDSLASYTSLLSRETGLINWKEASQATIYHLYQGTKPWPGLFTYLNNKRFKCLEIKKVKDETLIENLRNYLKLLEKDETTCYFENAIKVKTTKTVEHRGFLFSPNGKQLFMLAKDGFLELLRFQVEGQKEQTATMVAHNYKKGSFFSEKSY